MSLVKEIVVLSQLPRRFSPGPPWMVNLRAGDGPDRLQMWIEGRQGDILELADLAGEIMLYSDSERGAIVVGSELGGHIYIVDLTGFAITCELSLKRDNSMSERTCALHITPNGKRVVVVSELAIVVLGWTGEVLMAHPLTSAVSFEAIEDGAIRLYDRKLEAEVAYKIPV